jgi:uncharacterized phage-like protein YoqJ
MKKPHKRPQVLCGAGHHAELLGGHDETIRRKLVQLADRWLASHEISQVISGMASGWDHALAIAALGRGIPLVAAVPFVGYEQEWPPAAQQLFHDILEMACEVNYLGGKEQRNEWMVDRSDRVLALWNGSEEDTTAHCIAYARRRGKPVDNLWSRWQPT